MDRFTTPGGDDSREFLHDVCLCNRDTGKIFYEHLGFMYIELVKFVKSEADLQSDLDRWLYVLKNMSVMDRLPIYLRKPIFEKLFQIAQYSNLNREEQTMYNRSLRNKWDEYSIRETVRIEKEEARQEGLHKGRQEGLQEGRQKEALAIALEMKRDGIPLEQIIRFTKLPKEEIEKL